MSSSRFFGCASLLTLSVVMQTKLWAQQMADELKSVPSPPAKLLEVKSVEQHAAYWSSEPGWDVCW